MDMSSNLVEDYEYGTGVAWETTMIAGPLYRKASTITNMRFHAAVISSGGYVSLENPSTYTEGKNLKEMIVAAHPNTDVLYNNYYTVFAIVSES